MQTQYQSQFGRYASSLQELGPTAGGSESPAGAELISGELARGRKSGYAFALTATAAGYSITAIPDPESMGRRTFYSDQTMIIRSNWSREPATAASAEIQ